MRRWHEHGQLCLLCRIGASADLSRLWFHGMLVVFDLSAFVRMVARID
jgi:hypothetical protein